MLQGCAREIIAYLDEKHGIDAMEFSFLEGGGWGVTFSVILRDRVTHDILSTLDDFLVWRDKNPSQY